MSNLLRMLAWSSAGFIVLLATVAGCSSAPASRDSATGPRVEAGDPSNASGADDEAQANAGAVETTAAKDAKSPDGAAADGDALLTGRCHCGHITYTSPGPVKDSNYCGCPGCRRATGTFKAPFVRVPRKGFKLTGGEPATYDAKGDEHCDAHGVWHFCPKCGAQIYWEGHRGKLLDVFAGTLDDPSAFRPKENAD